MKTDRRGFLKIGCLGILGFAAGPLVDILLRGRTAEALPELPAAATAGKRWAMAVNVNKCKNGCRDCINICHSVHNVPDFGNPKDEVKWIWEEPYRKVFPEQEQEFGARGNMPVVVLCNHCDNPPCVRVCPTKATFKRKDGIVAMDYHRCIGCRYCMAACPYGARSANWRDPRPFIRKINPGFPTRMKGVVEKCDFCVERITRGLIPACVEACKEKALVFGNLKDPGAELREILRANHTLRRRPELGTVPQVYYIV
ncbi:MAG: 4Fe-4S dicluster domain-containing protein [Syntrophales bacterium]|nr:4Fe-4S dicluster domain-containing protein [Syntrophales bacterium]